MPAEWEKHEATWLSWPHLLDHWPGKFEPIPVIYGQMVKVLAESENVYINVNDETMEAEAKKHILASGISEENFKKVKFFHIPTNASWARDHGPIFVRDTESKKLIIEDWIFNGWGNKWPTDLDDVVPTKIGKTIGIPVIETKMVLEGGSIDVNGKGLLLTTTECLLNKNRNPDLSKEQIEVNLAKYLGVKKVLWLGKGIIGDDTDVNVDDLSRFVNENTIVTVVEKNPQDPNYQVLQDNLQLLKQMTDLDGKPLNIVELPMPTPVIHEGLQLPASYANFYIANTVVLLPIFNCPQDQEAIKILEPLFPGRKVLGIDCNDLVWGLGTFHCSTQQQPA